MRSKRDNLTLVSSDKNSDTVLWEKVRSGNHEALAEIFKLHYAGLFAYGIKIVPFHDFVRDHIQELFLTIWQSHDRLSSVSNIKAYLLVSLRRLMLKSRKSTPTEDLNEKGNGDFLIFEQGEFVDREVISSQIKEQLLENINALPNKHREVVFLRFYHDLSYREIAEIVEIKEQTIKNMMPGVFSKLRNGLTNIKRDDLNDLDVMLFEFFTLFKRNF
ncbi:RNA polymerase sigma factor [Puteibacter caeruleilacunae]|nr:RNA polymerase sigma factor [Puteibacter caeruleilacunae]